ncbi:MAG TPA: double zinc ribbon domain-containing protein [Gammaproteobacteria bacterium]
MNKWLKHGQNWLLPRSCLICFGEAGRFNVCPHCVSILPRIARACEGCGIPLASGRLCAPCLDRPRLLNQVCIPYRYEAPLSGLILQLKFHHRVEVASLLADLLLQQLPAPGPRPTAIVPVPLHAARLRRRGFNQALEISRPLGRALGVPLAPRLATRCRNTTAQSSLGDPAARRSNLRGAFVVDANNVAGIEHVVIVDDVVTTGATARELARALNSAGVTRIDLWSVARAASP